MFTQWVGENFPPMSTVPYTNFYYHHAPFCWSPSTKAHNISQKSWTWHEFLTPIKWYKINMSPSYLIPTNGLAINYITWFLKCVNLKAGRSTQWRPIKVEEGEVGVINRQGTFPPLILDTRYSHINVKMHGVN